VTGKPLVLDTNLLVLLVVGSASLTYLGVHKNVKAYSVTDFRLLQGIVLSSHKIFTTPNILTETSNLARQFGRPARDRITQLLAAMIEPLEEIYIESRVVAQRPEFERLGLTDCAILDALEPTHTLLTADLDLYLAALKQGNQAVNFNHLRERYL
jgi:hypothetical protein